jgi:hypothetical protein
LHWSCVSFHIFRVYFLYCQCLLLCNLLNITYRIYEYIIFWIYQHCPKILQPKYPAERRETLQADFKMCIKITHIFKYTHNTISRVRCAISILLYTNCRADQVTDIMSDYDCDKYIIGQHTQNRARRDGNWVFRDIYLMDSLNRRVVVYSFGFACI